eukprot:724008-Pleurochrysis_carterae.AAC.3
MEESKEEDQKKLHTSTSLATQPRPYGTPSPSASTSIALGALRPYTSIIRLSAVWGTNATCCFGMNARAQADDLQAENS